MAKKNQTYYVDVILPLNLWNSFTYRVSEDEFYFLHKGMRVAVNFGKSGVQTGLVFKKHHDAPKHYQTKNISHIVDNESIVTKEQWELWQFISDYYLTPLGLVMKAALPASFMLESNTYLLLNQDVKVENEQLNDDEFMLIEALKLQKSIDIKSLQNILDKKNVISIVNGLIKKSLIHSLQEVNEKYKPKTEHYIQLHKQWKGKDINLLFEKLAKNAEKQRELLLKFFAIQRNNIPVLKKRLLMESSAGLSSLKGLIKKDILQERITNIDRINFEKSSEKIKTLSEDQQEVLKQIKQNFQTEKPQLFKGVTSSGKTEIYIHIIKDLIKQKKQVLYLVPEIALTTQLVQRLVKVFGNDIAVYHSRYSQQERREVWMHVLKGNNQAKIILGARSAIFLPFNNLDLIVVDEEHESSYKQHKPAPRYQARDMAVLLGKIHQAKVLLGSATPSIESSKNAEKQKYTFVKLDKRYKDVKLPEIQIVDLKEQLRKKRNKGNFSDFALKEIEQNLQEKKQIIVFQNRRGYAPVSQCEDCGHVIQCPNCDVSLTLHKSKRKLKCHYCGYQMSQPVLCPACGNPSISYKGIGTEQIQNDLQQIFPEAVVGRMDSDMTKAKNSFAKIISDFQNLETDILVGTQMLVKGLDFENVGLVLVMNADQLLYYPDFRADERSFQMLLQVAGRAGRKKEQGKVLIQTFNPRHPVLKMVKSADYQKMYDQQLLLRKNLYYPPFSKLIRFELKDRNPQKVLEASQWLAKSFENYFSKVLGPSDPLIPRIRNKYIKEIVIKLKPNKQLDQQKKMILKIIHTFNNIPQYKSVRVNIDVDPY